MKARMTTLLTQAAAPRNEILRGLSTEKYQRLFSNLKLVSLSSHQVLYNPEDTIRFVYFVNHGMVSLLSTTSEGDSIEVGNVGKEGVVGVPVIQREVKTPYQIVVRIPGDAWMVSTDILEQEFDKRGELKDCMLDYAYARETYFCQLGVCNHFHTLDKRLCRWLLIASYQVQTETFHLTHESLSQVLGTGRTGITMAANRLQKSGLIRYYRGRITILDRAGMEATSCACFQISKEIFEDLSRSHC